MASWSVRSQRPPIGGILTGRSLAAACRVARRGLLGICFKWMRQEPKNLGRRVDNMEKHYYNAASLERTIRVFEERFHRDSESLLAAYRDDRDSISDIPPFIQHSWASFYIEWRDVCGTDDDLTDRVRRELQLA